VHDWDNVNASLIASWRNGARGGRRKPTGNPRITQGQPASSTHNKYSTDKIRRSGLPIANPQVSESQLSPEEAKANRRRFAAELKGLSEKLKADRIEDQNQKEN